ncbi:retrovirus-related pol polyprotein from transposon TNT 1-94 [Tanacetum coccineum]|uniref:Retrovirus-related pol polyprotein from transposon TNT 1-94 n=1 Tax=Tanacetum coccineum TaxID=301880 RepID=A0ABQ5CGX6_9ASTR
MIRMSASPVCLRTKSSLHEFNGTEVCDKSLDGWFESVGISHETSVPRSPQQNGVVERRNRTLMEAARTMLIFAKAPLFLWAEALISNIPSRWDPVLPTMGYDVVGKLKAKADIGIFVGYAPTKKAYRIYNKECVRFRKTYIVATMKLTEGLTSVQTSSGLAPQQMTSVLKYRTRTYCFTVRRSSRSHLYKGTQNHLVVLLQRKQVVDDLFQWFDMMRLFRIPPECSFCRGCEAETGLNRLSILRIARDPKPLGRIGRLGPFLQQSIIGFSMSGVQRDRLKYKRSGYSFKSHGNSGAFAKMS